MNTAIIVAAGSGKRFGKLKQFTEILGKPLIIHTLGRFQNCNDINEIVLVLPESEVSLFSQIAQKFGVTKLMATVAGGATRAESVWSGLKAVNVASDVVTVHDGARPLVTEEEISATVRKAAETGAACLVAPVADTIKEVSPDGIITNTIDRSKLRRALTPQAFRKDLLTSAFWNATELDDSVTDECYLVERLGHPISIVEGSSRNIKITVEDDLKIAERLLADRE